jgi:cytochrome c-type biogenesis protein CcmH
MNRRVKTLLLVICALILIAIPSVALAQESTPVSDDEVNKVAQDMFCPVCENIPLDVCPTQACAQWRELIRQKLALGWSEEQVKQYFVEQYGAQVLAVPPRMGLNWAIYILPPLVIIGGTIFVLGILKRSKKAFATLEPTPKASTSADENILDKIEADLRRDE